MLQGTNTRQARPRAAALQRKSPQFTHPQRVLFPAAGVTKRQLRAQGGGRIAEGGNALTAARRSATRSRRGSSTTRGCGGMRTATTHSGTNHAAFLDRRPALPRVAFEPYTTPRTPS